MKLFDRIVAPVLALPRPAKRGLVMAVDAALCVLTVWLALFLRLGEWIALSGDPWPATVASIGIALPIFVAFGLYRTVFRYVSGEALVAVFQAVFIYGLIYSAMFTAFSLPGIPRTVGIIQPVLLLIAIGASRVFARYLLTGRYRRRFGKADHENVLIYGAGSSGRQLASALSDAPRMRVVGFIDDEPQLQGSLVGGIRVSSPDRLPEIIEKKTVSAIFLAIPSASRRRRKQVLDKIRPMGVTVRTLPGIQEIVDGRVQVSQLRPLAIEDVLGRDSVEPDWALLEGRIRGRVVLVTGAGGSIGTELCRQIMALHPRVLLLIDASEFALYSVHSELAATAAATAPSQPVEIVPLLGSVCDEARMRRIFAAWRPEVVYHAAAYKHVPLVEHNPLEGIRNNVLGTWVTARAARDHGAARFVLVSTDKAVRPTNIMGASKRLSEMLLQALASEKPATCFSMVRFGNVLGSSGSVVPLFRKQISAGGPVTVTHREATRYFMTIPEAAQLVLQAGAMADGGEVFILDMGEPVKVMELATRMIELSGYHVRNEAHPDGDIEIVFTGLRPGEKLYEELLIGNDPTATDHPRIMRAVEHFLPLPELRHLLDRLSRALDAHDVEGTRSILARLVPEYKPASELVDWVHQEEKQGRAAAVAPVREVGKPEVRTA